MPSHVTVGVGPDGSRICRHRHALASGSETAARVLAGVFVMGEEAMLPFPGSLSFP